MANISDLVAKKAGCPGLLDDLSKNLSASELNSLLLELFRIRAKMITPAELLRKFEKSKFAAPSEVDTISFKELELRCLKLAKNKGFSTITLSPLAPFGTCSAVGFVDQNNVVTALRGTEVVSDATNVFAMLIAKQLKRKSGNGIIKYAATHRHVRSQALLNPIFTPHFGIFCLATGGFDSGNFSFELEQLIDHITTHLSLFSSEFDLKKERWLLRLYLKDENVIFHQKLEARIKTINDEITVKMERQLNPGDYYKLVQFKFFIQRNEQEINLSDGGLVDWTQKLIPNKKHRMIISGVGTELIHKMNRSKQ